MLYLEIKKENGAEFLLEEGQILRRFLGGQIKGTIERSHPISMPRKEEKILRNVMLLSRKVRFLKDLPQSLISFLEAKGGSTFLQCILSENNPIR